MFMQIANCVGGGGIIVGGGASLLEPRNSWTGAVSISGVFTGASVALHAATSLGLPWILRRTVCRHLRYPV